VNAIDGTKIQDYDEKDGTPEIIDLTDDNVIM
jgi:hypothetical protein